MYLFQGSAEVFEALASTDELALRLAARFHDLLLVRPSESEINSWKVSLRLFAPIVREAAPDAAVVLEYMLPLSSKRLDVVLVGRDRKGGAHAVVVELKQWDSALIENVDDCLVTVGNRILLHPQQQLLQYVRYLRDFNVEVHEGRLVVDGCVFLHNASDAAVHLLQSATPAGAKGLPIFGSSDVDALRKFLTERLGGGDGAEVADQLLEAETRPAKRLLDHVAEEIRGQTPFTLLDEQLVALELVERAVEDARVSGHKHVVAVTGGPGTGKSLIAARLVGVLAAKGFNVSHATGSRSFTLTLRKRVGQRAGQVFRYFNNFTSADLDELDVLVCDEAHRIRESSNSRFTPKHKRSELPQVDELIQVARVPVFLLDENQVVRPGESGTVESIRAAAARNGADFELIALDGQFRSLGSAAYVEWVERFLGLRPGGPAEWPGDDPFEVVVADSVELLEQWCHSRAAEGFTARLAAGFCWPWSDPTSDGSLIDDVVVGDWRRPWNAKPGKRVVGAPPADFWASDPEGLGQVGCIYTAQGFEYDYGGVIIGLDLVWRDGRLASDSKASADSVVRRAESFDELVRHVYKVLLTRGLRGCAIHALDPALQDCLMELIGRAAVPARRLQKSGAVAVLTPARP